MNVWMNECVWEEDIIRDNEMEGNKMEGKEKKRKTKYDLYYIKSLYVCVCVCHINQIGQSVIYLTTIYIYITNHYDNVWWCWWWWCIYTYRHTIVYFIIVWEGKKKKNERKKIFVIGIIFYYNRVCTNGCQNIYKSFVYIYKYIRGVCVFVFVRSVCGFFPSHPVLSVCSRRTKHNGKRGERRRHDMTWHNITWRLDKRIYIYSDIL